MAGVGSISLRSERSLVEAARHFYWPIDRAVSSVWPDVVRPNLVAAGVEFDRWQDDFSMAALALGDDELYVSTVGGVTVSIPRQVGKTFTVGRVLVGLAISFPRLEVAWTSHHATTTTNTFQSMQGIVGPRTGLAGKVAPNGIRKANGQEQITFRNGSRIRFGAREHGFGRGLDKIDVLVFDEAQILTLKALEDMVPTTNQSRHPHGALIFFLGTPPRPIDPGEAFQSKRLEALDGHRDRVLPDGMFVEFSADPGADPDDREQWKVANPSFPHRTPEVSMLRMKKNIPDVASWRREALGIWDQNAGVEEAPPAFNLDRWAAGVVEEAPEGGRPVYGVKFSVDGSVVALAAAVKPDSGPVHVEGIDQAELASPSSFSSLVSWLAARDGQIVVDGKGYVDAFVKELVAAGVQRRRIRRMSVTDVIGAAAGLQQAILAGDVTHLDDEALALDDVVRREIGKQGGWGLAGRHGEDVSLIEAVMLAHWGASTLRGGGGRSGGGRRRAVVM